MAEREGLNPHAASLRPTSLAEKPLNQLEYLSKIVSYHSLSLQVRIHYKPKVLRLRAA